MTNDQQQVEAWRTEFEPLSGYHEMYLMRNDDNTYQNKVIETCFLGFCMAKRNQPVIDLPKKNFVTNSYYFDDIHDAIGDAGYSYKVR